VTTDVKTTELRSSLGTYDKAFSGLTSQAQDGSKRILKTPSEAEGRGEQAASKQNHIVKSILCLLISVRICGRFYTDLNNIAKLGGGTKNWQVEAMLFFFHHFSNS